MAPPGKGKKKVVPKLKQKKIPAKVAKLPTKGTKGAKLPAKVLKLPSRVAKLPAKVLKLPSRVAKLPANVLKLPPRVAKLPAKVLKLPSKVAKGSKPCVVVFITGECECYDSIDEARIQRQSLPASLIKEFKEFESQRAAMIFMKDPKTASIDAKMSFLSDKKIAAVTPDKKSNTMNKRSAFFNDISAFKKESKVAGLMTNKESIFQSGISGHKKFLQSITQNANCVNNVLRVFVCKFNANQELPAGYKLPESQVIVIDMFDQNKKSTYWTHKPKAWTNIFETGQATEPDLFEDECYHLQSFPFRDLNSSKKNDALTYHYKSPRGGVMNIPVEGLYALVPISWTTSEILDFVSTIGTNMLKPTVKEGYSQSFPNSAATFRSDIDSTNGPYWSILQAVFMRKNIKVSNFEALAEIFCNDVVLVIMAELFQDDSPAIDWNDEPRLTYAFKNVLDGEDE
jgi:hypothetical protein